jgi:phospholipase/carboxylesterase
LSIPSDERPASLEVASRPAAEPEHGALVLFHGRGADEYDLLPLLDGLDPRKRFDGFCPRAPLTLSPGAAHWYIVPRVGYPDPDTFAIGYAAAAGFVDSLPHSRIVLGGFSQGAVMALALATGVGRPRPAAVIAFSGFLPEVDGWQLDEDDELPPIAIVHGTEDAVIPVEFGRRTRERLEEVGATVTYNERPIGHTIHPEDVTNLSAWLWQELAWH